MKLRDTPEIYGYTIFCDDMRQEVGGKNSFIGCYNSIIFIHTPFPASLPKFCFCVTLNQRREILDPNIELKIFMPGDIDDSPSFQGVWSEPSPGFVAHQTARAVEGLPAADQRTVSMQAVLITAPLVIKEAGMIKVRAMRQGELIRLGSIRVVQAPQQDGPPTT
jgi:hypothetical protein